MATAAARYEALRSARNTVLDQAREASRLTIPGLIPEEGASNPHEVTEQPYTSLGARGVNNISAKLLISQFPPERPFFKQEVSADTAEELGSELGEVTTRLADISREAMIIAESSGSRPAWMEVFRHLVVAGNVLVYHPDDGTKLRLWRLDQYVVRRDATGRMMEVVTKEEVYPSELEESVRNAVGLDQEDDGEENKEKKEEKKVSLYTWVQRMDNGRIEHFEEINGTEVPGSRGSVEAEKAGWQALRWQEVPGSDYGRSYVSEYAGDFLTLEDGMKAILTFAAEAARILRIVDPNSGLDIEELATAESGEFLTGYADKITTLQLDKSADFKVLWDVVSMVERRISQAFLLTSNTIRDAERVTAEEIRAIAQELEDTFGGTYSVLSEEVQKPYAKRLLHILNKQGKAPELPPSVSLVIVTGFSALGRNHETAALREWLADLKEVFGDKWVATSLDGDEVAKRLGVGRGVVNVEGLLKSPDKRAQEGQEADANEAMKAAAPQIAKGVMDAANKENPVG